MTPDRPLNFSHDGIAKIPELTPAQADTLAFLSRLGVTYCGRNGAAAFAVGDAFGDPLAFVVSPEGFASRCDALTAAVLRAGRPARTRRHVELPPLRRRPCAS